MEPMIVWLRLAAGGGIEKLLSGVVQKHGVSAVVRHLQVERDDVHAWARARKVPDELHDEVRALHERLLGHGHRGRVVDAERAPGGHGAGVVDLDVARQMQSDGKSLSEIGDHFGVTKQAVSKALKKAEACDGA